MVLMGGDLHEVDVCGGTHRAFVFSYRKAVSQAVKSGHILQPDAKLMRRWADGSDIGG